MKVGRSVWIAAGVVVLAAAVGLAAALLGPKPQASRTEGTGATRIGTETVIATAGGPARSATAAAGGSSTTTGAGAEDAEKPVATITMRGTGARAVPDGKRFGYVRKAWKDGDRYFVSVDVADLLTDDAAAKAAAARGEKPPANGYLIVDDDKATQDFELSPEATVRYVADGAESTQLVESSPEALTQHWAKGDVRTLQTLPYFVTVKGDLVVQLDQIYLP